MEQLLTHLISDYWLQPDFVANSKNKNSWICLMHVLIYTACFLILTTSWKALLVIGATHFIIDRFPIIVKRLIWFKNHLNPNLSYVPFRKCGITGMYDNIQNEVSDLPFEKLHVETITDKNGKVTHASYTPRLNYISIWLYIITDNSIHLTINYLALKYLG